jgi:hypothetical protein
VINETAARLYWFSDDPIGRTIRFAATPRESLRIVGVVGDIRSLGPGEPAPPAVYLPLAQSAPPPAMLGRTMQFVIRTSGNPMAVAAAARAAVGSIDPELPLVGLRPMTEVAALVGVPAALVVTRLMGGVLPGVTAAAPVTYAAVVARLAAPAFMASYFPAGRATRVDPIVALRAD